MCPAPLLQLPSVDSVEYWRAPDKAGWLQSQSEVMKMWRKRWFVLKQGYLFRFLTPDVSGRRRCWWWLWWLWWSWGCVGNGLVGRGTAVQDLRVPDTCSAAGHEGAFDHQHAHPNPWHGCCAERPQNGRAPAAAALAHLPPRCCAESVKPRGVVDLSKVQDVKDGRSVTGKANSIQLKTASGGSVCYVCDSGALVRGVTLVADARCGCAAAGVL